MQRSAAACGSAEQSSAAAAIAGCMAIRLALGAGASPCQLQQEHQCMHLKQPGLIQWLVSVGGSSAANSAQREQPGSSSQCSGASLQPVHTVADPVVRPLGILSSPSAASSPHPDSALLPPAMHTAGHCAGGPAAHPPHPPGPGPQLLRVLLRDPQLARARVPPGQAGAGCAAGRWQSGRLDMRLRAQVC